MSEPREARQLLEMAEHAALDGDLSSADELLREAARLQEAELGPLHPDLANTLNNLAIVAEKTGRPADAETFFRRAVAIASASLAADHPMVIESRKNLEDFCRDRGLPIVAAAVIAPAAQPVPPTPAPPVLPSPPPSPSQPPAPTRPPSPARAPAPPPSSRRREWVAIGAMVLAIVAVLVWRPWSSPEISPSPAAPQAVPAAPQATPPPPSPPVAAAPIEKAQPPIEKTQPPKVVPRNGISLITAQVCQTFSTSGSRWRCDPVGDSVDPRRLALYTRVRSSRDATVVHRWYRNDVLQQAVELEIDANGAEGYRTYSRQTVGTGSWRVEVLNADGDLLHEQRFTVR